MDEVKYFKDSSNYWYSQCAKETQLRGEFESQAKELQEWIEEVAISNCRAYDFGYSEGYRKGLVDANEDGTIT